MAWAGSAHVTQLELPNFGWTSYGIASFGAFDRGGGGLTPISGSTLGARVRRWV